MTRASCPPPPPREPCSCSLPFYITFPFPYRASRTASPYTIRTQIFIPGLHQGDPRLRKVWEEGKPRMPPRWSACVILA